LRVARAYDEGDEARDFRRFATAVMKYWLCKQAPGHAAEALECLGGNGYVEDSGMPVLHRGAPLGSIWEGSGNVAALDVLRALVKEPQGLPAFMEECEAAAGGNRRLDAHLAETKERVAGSDHSHRYRRPAPHQDGELRAARPQAGRPGPASRACLDVARRWIASCGSTLGATCSSAQIAGRYSLRMSRGPRRGLSSGVSALGCCTGWRPLL
jgi:hypothetical protein